MITYRTEIKPTQIAHYICDNCTIEIPSDYRTLHISPGYPHWADCVGLDFCSDQCLIDFFQKGIIQHGGWKAVNNVK